MKRSGMVALATAGTLLVGCTGGEARDDAPNHPPVPAVSQFHAKIGETGLRWVEVETATKANVRCSIDMSYILNGLIIVDNFDRPSINECRIDDRILPGQIPKNFNQTLEDHRKTWEQLTYLMANLITDGVDESIGKAEEHTWALHVGDVSIPKGEKAPIIHFNDGKEGRYYGYDACSIGDLSGNKGTQEIRTIGHIKDDVETYSLGIVLTDREDAAQCGIGSLILIPETPVMLV